MKAVLFYDGSIKNLNDDYSIDFVKDADSVEKVNGYYLVDDNAQTLDGPLNWKIKSKAKKGLAYGDKLFYYGIDKKIYMCEENGESTEVYNNKNNYDVVMNAGGILVGCDFVSPDGSFERGQFWAEDTIVKIEKIDSKWHKSIRDIVGNSWVEVGSGLYSDFVKGASATIGNKTVFTRGATIDNGILTEPVYNPVKRIFEGGNAFSKFIQPRMPKPIFKTIGTIGGIVYFLCARDGSIYKYNTIEDTLTKWVSIVAGTGNDGIIDSKNLFKVSNPFITENEIIYFDGEVISRIDVSTGVKNELAIATNFQGWAD